MGRKSDSLILITHLCSRRYVEREMSEKMIAEKMEEGTTKLDSLIYSPLFKRSFTTNSGDDTSDRVYNFIWKIYFL